MHYAPAWIPFVHLEPKSHPVSFQLFITVKIVYFTCFAEIVLSVCNTFQDISKEWSLRWNQTRSKKAFKRTQNVAQVLQKKTFCSVFYSGVFSWWPVSLLIEIDAYGWMVTSAHATYAQHNCFFALLFLTDCCLIYKLGILTDKYLQWKTFKKLCSLFMCQDKPHDLAWSCSWNQMSK